MSNKTSKYFSFFNNTSPASWVRIEQGISLHVVPVRIIVPW